MGDWIRIDDHRYEYRGHGYVLTLRHVGADDWRPAGWEYMHAASEDAPVRSCSVVPHRTPEEALADWLRHDGRDVRCPVGSVPAELRTDHDWESRYGACSACHARRVRANVIELDGQPVHGMSCGQARASRRFFRTADMPSWVRTRGMAVDWKLGLFDA